MDKEKLKNIILAITGITSFIYIGYILNNNIQSVDDIFKYISIELSILAIIPSIMVLVTQCYLHALIIGDIEADKITDKFQIYSAYSTSQLVRYLPGKVWGIIYQSETLIKRYSRITIWYSNLIQTIISLVNSVVVLGFIYLYTSHNKNIAILYAIVGVIALYIIISRNIIYKLSNVFLNKKYHLPQTPAPSITRIIIEISLLQIEWLFYFSAWYFLAPANAQESGFILIGTAYAAASLVGMLAFVMPNGWLVREASFIWLGGLIGLSQSLLIIYSVLARIIFIIADICWAILAKIISKLLTEEAFS